MAFNLPFIDLVLFPVLQGTYIRMEVIVLGGDGMKIKTSNVNHDIELFSVLAFHIDYNKMDLCVLVRQWIDNRIHKK